MHTRQQPHQPVQVGIVDQPVGCLLLIESLIEMLRHAHCMRPSLAVYVVIYVLHSSLHEGAHLVLGCPREILVGASVGQLPQPLKVVWGEGERHWEGVIHIWHQTTGARERSFRCLAAGESESA